MADQPNKPSSTPHRQGYSGREGMVQEQMDSQVHQIRNDDERQGGAIPEEAGNDFTFPDEDTTLGKKSGDDVPGEPAKNRE